MSKVTAAVVGPGDIGTDLPARPTHSPTVDVRHTVGVDPASEGPARRARDLGPEAAERYGVSAHEILRQVGEAGHVGGQEDMTIDIAPRPAEEHEKAGAGR
jgi:acetaldehyde dehydrogenase (acetylating)